MNVRAEDPDILLREGWTYNGNGSDDSAEIHRFTLIPFKNLTPRNVRRYLIKHLFPRVGFVLVWGAPKCGKSFWTFDAVMHIASGWEYRGRRVQQGPVVYCAFEDAEGFRAMPASIMAVPIFTWRAEMEKRGVLDTEAANPRADFKRLKDSL